MFAFVNGFELSGDFKELLQENNPAPLGKNPRIGRVNCEKIQSIVDRWAAEVQPANAKRQLIHALLLLWHDHLDESHSIAQEIKSASGSLVHAMMHRREEDFWNAKYWYGRVGRHPVYARYEKCLKGEGADLISKNLLSTLGANWNPVKIVDEVETVISNPETAGYKDLQRLQYLETAAFIELLSENQ
jgi:hypothetical protein